MKEELKKEAEEKRKMKIEKENLRTRQGLKNKQKTENICEDKQKASSYTKICSEGRPQSAEKQSDLEDVPSKMIKEIIEKLEKSKIDQKGPENTSPIRSTASINELLENSKEKPQGSTSQIVCIESKKEEDTYELSTTNKTYTSNSQQMHSSHLLGINAENGHLVITNNFNQIVEHSPVLTEIKTILQEIATTCMPRHPIIDDEVSTESENRKEKTHQIEELASKDAKDVSENKTANSKEKMKVILENVGTPSSSAPVGKTKKWTPQKAEEFIKKITVTKTKKKEPKEFYCYRITKLPNPRCAITQVERAWRAVAEIKSTDLGLLTMLSETEAQFLVSKRSTSKLQKIVDVYNKSGAKVVLHGPVDPLLHRVHTQQEMFKMIRDRAVKVLSVAPSHMTRTPLYEICERIFDCENISEFKTQITDLNIILK